MIEHGMICQSLVEVASEWLDGGLTAEERLRAELHIATCAGCIAYVGQLRTTRDALGTLHDGPPADDVRASLLEVFRNRRPRPAPPD